MTKIELFILITLGFFIFAIIFIRIHFLFGNPIENWTITFAFSFYCILLAFLFSRISIPTLNEKEKYLSLFSFIIFSIIVFSSSLLLAKTYDTSWDGQGYHQTAVIALASGWNPLYDPSIHLMQKLPSQIFAEGYPSAFWEIQASIFSLTERINSAKITNFFIGIIAGLTIYCLLRKLSFGKILSILISFLLVIQPIYVLQLLTFMQDGLGYELLLIATSTLTIGILFPKSYWALALFFFTELLLVGTKYSHLPVALVLGVIFTLIVGNRLLNHEYILNRKITSLLLGCLLISMLFFLIPYGRNAFWHRALFYPTNITELMGSVKYNNIPKNIKDKDNISLLFYGIFSKSQSIMSGDPRSKTNIAELKIPFTFSTTEITASAALYNNRVGGGGPLFSGIVLLTILFLLSASFRTITRKQRYALYTSYFFLIVIVALSLSVPTPNLLRYVNQLQILPFVVLIPLYAAIKNRYIKTFTFILLFFISINTFFGAGS